MVTRENTGILRREAAFRPASAETVDGFREIDVVLSTGSAVLRENWEGVQWIEELRISSESVRLDRVNNGAPFIREHSSSDLAQLGKFVEGTGRVEDVEGVPAVVARVRFSRHLDEDSERIVGDILDGIRGGISIGYVIHREEVIASTTDGEVERRIAVDFEIYEGSVLPIPADTSAGFRSAPAARGDSTMKTRTVANTLDTSAAATPAAPDPAALAAPDSAQLAAARAEGVKIEAERAAAVRLAVRTLAVSAEELEGLAGPGSSPDAVRAAAFDLAAAADEAAPVSSAQSTVEIGQTEDDTIARAIEEAILYGSGVTKKLGDMGRRYAGRSALDLARITLGTASGGSYRDTMEMSNSRVASLVVRGASGGAGPAHFAQILDSVILAAVQQGEAGFPLAFKEFGERDDSPDLRERYLLAIGELGPLEEIPAGGEYKRTVITSGRERLSLVKRGRAFVITEEVVLRDALGAVIKAARSFGELSNVAQRTASLAPFTASYKMADAAELFSTARGNQVAAGSVSPPTIDAIVDMIVAMQTRPSRGQNMTAPKILRHVLTPTVLRAAAERALGITRSPTVPTKAADATPSMVTDINVLSDPLLDAAAPAAWYGMADRAVTYSYLSGEEGVSIVRRDGRNPDGIEFLARLWFGVAVADWRPLQKNPGA